MRLVPRSWSNELWVCSIRGHHTPAAGAAQLRPTDRELGIDVADGRRLSRCLRCDAWVDGWGPPVRAADFETLPPLDALDLPRRGEPLADAILLRAIAVSRALHSVVFGIVAVGLVLVETNLADLRSWADGWLARATDVAGETTGDSSRDWLTRELQRVADLDRHALVVLALTAAVYCVLEGVEAVGLWRERRWAEYLTVVATAGFLPIEVHELVQRTTVVRVGALVVNLVILGYLLWSKRLFGIRGGAAALEAAIDWEAVLSPPPT